MGASQDERFLSVYKQQVNLKESTQDVRVQASSSLPSLLVTGDVKGRYDDVMFGLLSTTTEDMNLNGSYYQDGMRLGRVLATIQTLSTNDPFHFMGIKWHDFDYATAEDHAKRDLLYLECMGWSTMANGTTMATASYGQCIWRHYQATEILVKRASLSAPILRWVSSFTSSQTAKRLKCSCLVSTTLADQPKSLHD